MATESHRPTINNHPSRHHAQLLRIEEFRPTPPECRTGIMGTSAKIESVQRDILELSMAGLNVLITGEAGTGKELAATALHNLDPKENGVAKGQLVIINCPAIPNTLAETELFGYETGSFTGASKLGRAGRLKKAHNGTVFLDEVGDIPDPIQSKLLRFLQTGEICPVGSSDIIHINAKVVAATNKDLESKVNEGQFRGDLYDRLNSVIITMPPLRTISEDVPRLVVYFAKKHKPERMDLMGVDKGVVDFMERRQLLGNGRELENCIRTAVLREFARAKASGNATEPQTLTLRYVESFKFRGSGPTNHTDPGCTAHPIGEAVPTTEKALTAEPGLTILQTAQKKMIAEVLKQNHNNLSATANTLKISRGTLRTRISKYGISLLPTTQCMGGGAIKLQAVR